MLSAAILNAALKIKKGTRKVGCISATVHSEATMRNDNINCENICKVHQQIRKNLSSYMFYNSFLESSRRQTDI